MAGGNRDALRNWWQLLVLWLWPGEFLRVGSVTLARRNVAGVAHDEAFERVYLRQPFNNGSMTELVCVDVKEALSRRRLRVWLRAGAEYGKEAAEGEE